MKMIKKIFVLCLVSSSVIFTSCKKDEEDTSTKTITVGVYEKQNDGSYTATGSTLTLVTQDACQTWSRTAQADNHSSSSHDHYNAAINVSYDEGTETVTWTEFGPELDQTSIDNTCAAGTNGVTKSASKGSYYLDKNIYLKIDNVQ